jgi:hypothetical protein
VLDCRTVYAQTSLNSVKPPPSVISEAALKDGQGEDNDHGGRLGGVRKGCAPVVAGQPDPSPGEDVSWWGGGARAAAPPLCTTSLHPLGCRGAHLRCTGRRETTAPPSPAVRCVWKGTG